MLEVRETIERARNVGRDRQVSCFRKHQSSYFSDLPLDIATVIAELVCPLDFTRCNVDDTRNLVTAFRWSLPNTFWKRRVDLFFELSTLKDGDIVDWQFLYLDLMLLITDEVWYLSSGLAYRRRVLEVIDTSRGMLI